MTTHADTFMSRFKGDGKTWAVDNLARNIDDKVVIEPMDEGYKFIHFTDGSQIGCRGRGKSFQYWIAGVMT